MSEQIDFYMEPVRFFTSTNFLSGTTLTFPEYDVVLDKDDALKLLFSQDVPSDYLIWEDFFSSLISDLMVDSNYNSAQKNIMKRIKESTGDEVKNNIRKKKEFLLRKKAGLAVNEVYDHFVKEVSDECYYMLTMVSTQRYLHKVRVESKLEELFDIMKLGLLPCGVKKNMEKIVVFNPLTLKNM